MSFRLFCVLAANNITKSLNYICKRELSTTHKSRINITDSCIKRLKEIGENSLRVEIIGGGCSGYQVHFSLENKEDHNDCVFERNKIRVIVDKKSLSILEGASVEYHSELIRAGFRVVNIKSASQSFQFPNDRLKTLLIRGCTTNQPNRQHQQLMANSDDTCLTQSSQSIGRSSSRPPMLTITEAARNQLTQFLKKDSTKAVKISLQAKGCAGISYKFDIISKNDRSQFKSGDELIEYDDQISLIIDHDAQMFIIGTEMDFIQDKLNSEFVFKNPNAVEVCGCGESFKFIDPKHTNDGFSSKQ
ncbi:hypothetical protein GJ496_009298 [Pomphorhynchus laevis]|nr:hypothetical protein GJ496_009298 [Pomphorhynchus laevis]